MDKFLINGPCKIRGEISISGSKNAALPILASTLLFDKPVIIKNLPRVKDIDTMLDLLRFLGSKISLSNDKKTAKIQNIKIKRTYCPYSIVRTFRGSIIVLGALIGKYQKCVISLPGGCLIGARPVNLHLSALKKLNMNFVIKKGYIHARVNKKLRGALIKFSKISVGATQNSIIAACLASGKTILKNCAIEPEIIDLTNFLNSAGANIKWIGKRTCQIIGVDSLDQTSYSVMGDRIEAGTFSVAAVANQGNLLIKNFDPKVIKSELELLKKVGAKIKILKNKILIKGPKKIKNINNVQTKEYPISLATDLQAQFMVLLCLANGQSTITENIFENRFMHVAELKRLGAKIAIKGNKAIINGPTKFNGAELMSSDLRASVALVLAAIFAKGKSIINRIYHLDRGYEKIEKKLRKVGAKIKRIKK
tara:strand:+ start:1069 stop:2337 length:1269 start_codon:yes stop_codon:yes gene_type:complete